MTNDNRETYSTLGFQTLLVLNRLKNERALRELAEEKQTDTEGKTQNDRTEKQKRADEQEFIEQRVAELARWERRISGKE